MHGVLSEDDEPMSEINMIPFIDIALTLLIIMMVTTVFVRNPGVTLKLPETAVREGSPETPKDLTIVVTTAGDTWIDGKPVAVEELRGRLREQKAKDADARILVKGDRDVAYRRIMEVMDEVRMAGLSRVVLPTDPKSMLPTASESPKPAAADAKKNPDPYGLADALRPNR